MQEIRAFQGNARSNPPSAAVPAFGRLWPPEWPEDEIAINPFSTNMDRMPAVLRLPFLKSLGESGNGFGSGLASALPFMDLRKGSIAAGGSLNGDEKARRKKRDFLEWLLAWSAMYRRLFDETAAVIVFAETHVEAVLETLDQSLAQMEETDTNGFADAADPQGRRALHQFREEARDFRDNELPEYRRRMESREPPAQEELQDIHERVTEKISRFARVRDYVARKAKEGAVECIKQAGEVTSEFCASAMAAVQRGIHRIRHGRASPGSNTGDTADYSND